jgi:hypothetical protein
LRKHDIHTGVDIHCEDEELVYSMTDGTIVKISEFTGPKAGSPWWNETSFIGVNTAIGYIIYGEVESFVKEGDHICSGDLIGKVKRVLKKDKGKPMSMLHVELYSKPTEPVVWNLNEPKPESLLDPSVLFRCLD